MVSWVKQPTPFISIPMEMNKQKKKKKKKLENVLALFYRGGPSHDRKLISGSHKHDQGEFCGCCLVAQLCLTLCQPHRL